MLSEKLQHKLHVMKVLSNNHASAIVLELMNARDAGKSPVPHKELLWLVDINIAGAQTLYWQQSIRELVDNLRIVELLVGDGKPYGPDTISYQINPNMSEFCAKLIKLLFGGEQGMREKLPPPPSPNMKSDASEQTKAPHLSH